MAVYGYVRVSTDRQADEGESLDVQRRKIEGRAKENGWSLDKVFVERGVSGAKPLGERKEGKALLSVLKPGDVVISSKLDRMFRSAHDALSVLQDLKGLGVSLWLLDMGGDVTGNGISALVFTILSAVATFERERIQERIRDTKEHQKKAGKYLGGAVPFGQRVGPEGQLEPDPKQQAAMKLIKKLSEEGRSLRVIAADVEQQLGLKISHMAVQKVIKGGA
ncbi:MAG TPA: recombinase family protein [Candidatus Sulfotelmatobacter sp.]|jgi:DNA invertase Pin-like site-specific DNA recombinase|nr:recombinase family protein [Candidatus Sulfotelmatobacter sp.]